MGGDNNDTKPDTSLVYQRSVNAYNKTQTPSPLENEFAQHAKGYQDAADAARTQNVADYGRIQQGYQDFGNNLGGPTRFSYQRVNADRPAELGESYGYLREAMPGYREFAQTGGYSPTDIQELRARGVSPIRTAYGNTMRELDRSRSLGGNGGSPNYIAAASRAQRELPGQMADATTNVNAGLADAIRQGRMFGLGGMTNTGSVMGGLSSQEANRMLQAAMANQSADIQTQGMSEASRWSLANAQLAGLGGQTNLYGTTPAMSATFGNQALNAYGQRFNAEQGRNQMALGLLGQQTGSAQNEGNKPSWWEKLLQAGGSAAPYLGGGDKTQGYNPDGSPKNPSANNGYYNPNTGEYVGAGSLNNQLNNYGGNNAEYPVWGEGINGLNDPWGTGGFGNGGFDDGEYNPYGNTYDVYGNYNDPFGTGNYDYGYGSGQGYNPPPPDDSWDWGSGGGDPWGGTGEW